MVRLAFLQPFQRFRGQHSALTARYSSQGRLRHRDGRWRAISISGGVNPVKIWFKIGPMFCLTKVSRNNLGYQNYFLEAFFDVFHASFAIYGHWRQPLGSIANLQKYLQTPKFEQKSHIFAKIRDFGRLLYNTCRPHWLPPINKKGKMSLKTVPKRFLKTRLIPPIAPRYLLRTAEISYWDPYFYWVYAPRNRNGTSPPIPMVWGDLYF